MTNGNGGREDEKAGASELAVLGIRAPAEFLFWFAAAMLVISVFVIIQKVTEFRAGDYTLYGAAFSGMRDIGTSIPVMSLASALLAHRRRIRMTLADFIQQKADEVRKRNQERDRRLAERDRRIRAEGRAWNRRRLEAEARGEPFDEPFPGDEEDSD